MEKSKLRLRDYLEMEKEIAILAHELVEEQGISYKEAIKKAKEKLLSERVGAHINSDNNNSKQFNDSITENINNEN